MVKVAVVGAGVVGLATTAELVRGGVQVRCFEADTPMGARSVGDTRIFRFAHRDPRLVDAARTARAGWDFWEREAGRPFVGREATVVSGVGVAEWADAMAVAGAPFTVVDSVTGLPSDRADGPFLHDPAGGVIQAAAAGGFLRQVAGDAVVPARVYAIEPGGSAVRVKYHGGHWDADSVIIAAGAGTTPLASTVDLYPPSTLRHHARFTFRLRDPAATPSCWLEQSGTWRPGFTSYGHLAGPGLWAVGGHLPDADTGWEIGREAAIERHRAATVAYVRDYLDGVEPEPVATVYCTVTPTAGDAFGAVRNGPVVAFWGDNLFKLAPLLGRLLATAAGSDGLPDELGYWSGSD